MSTLNLTKNDFEKIICSEKKNAVVDFWASWCSPCKMMSPVVDDFASKHSEIITGKVNVDDENELAVKYGVMSIPTIMFFKDGEPVNTLIGVQSEDEMEKALSESF